MQAKAESDYKLSVLHTDRGGEFTSKQFDEYCIAEGFQWHLTASYSPQQNGVAECHNALVIGATRSMIEGVTWMVLGGGGDHCCLPSEPGAVQGCWWETSF
jgi:hypothetical protein